MKDAYKGWDTNLTIPTRECLDVDDHYISSPDEYDHTLASMATFAFCSCAPPSSSCKTQVTY